MSDIRFTTRDRQDTGEKSLMEIDFDGEHVGWVFLNYSKADAFERMVENWEGAVEALKAWHERYEGAGLCGACSAAVCASEPHVVWCPIPKTATILSTATPAGETK